MSLFRVKYLSFFFLLISFFSFFNIIYSYYFNLYLNLNTYYFSLVISLIISILFYKMPKRRGAGRPKGSKNKPKTMKKVRTTKQAYSRPVRDQMMLRRAGVVETKVRVDSDIAVVNGHTEENDWAQPLSWKPLGYSNLTGVANLGTNAFTWIPLQSFTRISRGLGDDQMIGNNITSKYLKTICQI